MDDDVFEGVTKDPYDIHTMFGSYNQTVSGASRKAFSEKWDEHHDEKVEVIMTMLFNPLLPVVSEDEVIKIMDMLSSTDIESKILALDMVTDKRLPSKVSIICKVRDCIDDVVTHLFNQD